MIFKNKGLDGVKCATRTVIPAGAGMTSGADH